MNPPLKQTILLHFAFSLIVLWMACAYMGHVHNHHHAKLPNQWAGSQNLADHSHVHNADDVFFYNDNNLKSGNPCVAVAFHCISNPVSEDQYCACIWQPPRDSSFTVFCFNSPELLFANY